MKRILVFIIILLSMSVLCFGEKLKKTKDGYYSYDIEDEWNWICSEDSNTVVIFSEKNYYKVCYHMYFSEENRKSVENLLQQIITIYENENLYMTDILEQKCLLIPGALKNYFYYDDEIEMHINVIYNKAKSY